MPESVCLYQGPATRAETIIGNTIGLHNSARLQLLIETLRVLFLKERNVNLIPISAVI